MSAPDRANDPARRPSLEDVGRAIQDEKITMEEAHDLNPDIAHVKTPWSSEHYMYKLFPADRLAGKMQRSEERARIVHKNAKLTSKGDW